MKIAHHGIVDGKRQDGAFEQDVDRANALAG